MVNIPSSFHCPRKPILSNVIYALVAFALLSSCASLKSVSKDSSKIAAQSDRLQFAQNISQKILTAQSEDKYYPLTLEEATPRMVEGLNEQLQKMSYQQIKVAFGDFHGISFYELVKVDDNAVLEIYRFKGAFSSKQEVEVRTVLDQEGRLAGFFVKPWSDKI